MYSDTISFFTGTLKRAAPARAVALALIISSEGAVRGRTVAYILSKNRLSLTPRT